MDSPWAAVVWDLDGTLVVPGGSRPVAGVQAVLAAWAAAGVTMAVATSAPTAVARRTVDALGWAPYFGHVAGRAPGLTGKDDIVVEALLGLGRDLPEGAENAAMIGDSAGDMAAAHAHGLTAVGVTWSGAPATALVGADLIWPAPERGWYTV